VLDGRILEKPRSEADSYAMLKALSGRAHTVISAIALFLKGGGDAEPAVAMSVMTEVTFSDIDDELIYAYIRTGDPADKAGSYGIQSVGCQFIEKVGHFRRCVRSSRRDMSVITVMYSLPRCLVSRALSSAMRFFYIIRSMAATSTSWACPRMLSQRRLGT
jgi:Maf-like protein